jgi:hypothetical protein
MDSPSANNVIKIEAFLLDGQTLILPTLHGIIYDCGGWVLSRDYLEPNVACFLFEFPRDICVEIYSSLVSVGLDLDPPSHRVLAELCRCTPYLFDLPSRTIKAMDQASLDEATRYICSLEIVQVQLIVQFVAQTAMHSDGTGAA